MPSKRRREAQKQREAEQSAESRAEQAFAPPESVPGSLAPPAGPPPSPPEILPSPLGMLHWRRLKKGMPESGDEAAVLDYELSVQTLMRHAAVRERILADLVLRLDNLLTVCAKTSHYSDQLARRYCQEKLDFMVGVVNKAVIVELLREPT